MVLSFKVLLRQKPFLQGAALPDVSTTLLPRFPVVLTARIVCADLATLIARVILLLLLIPLSWDEYPTHEEGKLKTLFEIKTDQFIPIIC